MTEKRKGRPPNAEPSIPVSIRLPKSDHAFYIEIGGARWFKRLLAEEKQRQGFKANAEKYGSDVNPGV